jgi:hypothetical protein
MHAWQITGCAVVDVLGLPEEEFPFYNPAMRKRGARLVDFILSEEYFILGNPLAREYKRGYIYEKFFSFKCETARLRKLFGIFPSSVVQRFCRTVLYGTIGLFKGISH